MGNFYIKYDTTLQSNETYWFPLMTELLPVFTEVEVHCREDEKEAIYKIKPYAHTIRFESGFVIFTMPLNYRLKDLLLYEVSEGNRVIPWFRLVFKRNGSHICTVKQHGTELFFYQISIEDAKEIESFFPENTTIEYME
ncbi:hypothetical protein M9R32_04035 [Paenisporosarcina quisquiliarum]|uniref:Uncharacterized protein n=1 Tax=Paenisporosarcina quisquiliarum TaxID=365346 RepID=A0A9X3LEE7_9BACL|nr:hypothetical protein [Paenisporosarcina quisquiliarum]MCZ8536368.1 hypothetical protein [Paenisporosarcina quisquiliarum]